MIKPQKSLRFAILAAGVLAVGALVNAQAAEKDTRTPRPSTLMPLVGKSILLDVEAMGDRLVIVGERGHILVSDDAGKTWEQIRAPVSAMLTGLHVVNEKVAYAVGHDGSILRTNDAGSSWEIKHFDPSWGRPFYAAYFFSTDRGYVAGTNGRLLYTEDGGESWQEKKPETFKIAHHIFEFTLLNDGTLFAAGERGFMAYSTDDGQTWTMLKPPYTGSYYGAIAYGEAGFVTHGLRGHAYIAKNVHELPTEDPTTYDPFIAKDVTDLEELAAMGWKLVENPIDQSLFGATSLSDGNLIMVGVDGTLLHGSAASAKLKPVRSPTAEPISDVAALQDALILVGRAGVFRQPVKH